MSVMVLHSDCPNLFRTGQPLRKACGEVVGVEIMRHCYRRDSKESLIMLDGLLEVGVGLNILQVPNMVTQERFVILRQADRILLRCSASEDLRTVSLQGEWGRGISTRSAQRPHTTLDEDNAVVTPVQDLPIVLDKEISDVPETNAGLLVLDGDGLLTSVATGHYERTRVGCQ